MSMSGSLKDMHPTRPCALAIGGLDPGGGAGIAADFRAFQRAGVFGCAALSLTTVQSTNGLLKTVPLPNEHVVAMAREVLRAQDVRAIKTGALGSLANVQAVASLLKAHRDLPVVIDPVMGATRGRSRLASESAVRAIRKDLLPRATLVTPNVPEAEALTGERIANLSDAKRAAVRLTELGARAAVVKGGHLAGSRSVDVVAFHDGEDRDARQRVGGAVGDADVGTDREVGEVGDAAERRDTHHPRRPFPVAARGEAKGVILQGFSRGGQPVLIDFWCSGKRQLLLAEVLGHG